MVNLQIMHTNNTSLWGEIDDPDPCNSKVNLSSPEREFLSRIPRPLTLEGPKIHQPQCEMTKQQNQVIKKEKSIFELNQGYVTHGVHLLAYISELNKIKEQASYRRERGLPLPEQIIPPLPSLTAPNACSIGRTPFSHLEPVQPLSLQPSLPPLIHPKQAHSSLRKSVAAVTAFHGFDQSTDQALDVLTDATSHYLAKFCSLLRAARDKELVSHSKNGFPDLVCRAYEEMGIGSILNIRSYYKNAIIGRHKAIGETAEALAFECHHLDEVPSSSHFSVENGLLLEDPDNIPEIHFPSSEEGENGMSGPPTLSLDHNAPQIETGLQMLQSLEQYGSLDAGGSVMATPPPPSAQSNQGDSEYCEQPMSHDSNAALLLATVSPGSSSGNCNRKRRKTSDSRTTVF